MSPPEPSGYLMLGDVCVSARYAELLRSHGLLSLNALMSCTACHRLDKPGLPRWRERLQFELPDPTGTKVTLYLKRYRTPTVRAQCTRILSGWARHGTGGIEWYWMHRLAGDGVATVTPVAFAESMHRGRELCSVVVTEAAKGESLESWVRRRPERCPYHILESLAQFIKKFHELGYVHRDLYLSHIFINEAAQAPHLFCLIDLQRVFKPVWRRRRWVVKDLAALNYSSPKLVATTTDRLRFLRRYLGAERLGAGGKRLARRVASKTRRMARHDGRQRTAGIQSPALSRETPP